MANNALLFNAALAGYAAGMVAGSNITDATVADYNAQTTQAAQWATELDSLIATDTAGVPQPAGSTGISIAGGAAIVPAGSTAVFESQMGKLGLIYALSFSIAFQRFSTGLLAANFATQAAAVKALFFSAVPNVVVT